MGGRASVGRGTSARLKEILSFSLCVRTRGDEIKDGLGISELLFADTAEFRHVRMFSAKSEEVRIRNANFCRAAKKSDSLNERKQKFFQEFQIIVIYY